MHAMRGRRWHHNLPSALNGLDLEMPTGIYFDKELLKAVDAGEVPVAVLDEKLVRRFAKMIEFGDLGPQPKPVPIPVLEDGAVSRQIAAQGMVLLKNVGSLLPLDSGKSLKSVLTRLGRTRCGRSTGGGGSSHVIPLYTITPYDGLKREELQGRVCPWMDGSDIKAATDRGGKKTGKW